MEENQIQEVVPEVNPDQIINEEPKDVNQVIEPEVKEENHSNPKLEQRFKKLTAKLSAKDEEIAALRAQLETKAQSAPKQDKPKIEDFERIDEYTDAVTDWKLNQAIQAQKAQQAEASRMNAYNQKVAAFQQANPDFQEALAEVHSFLDNDMADLIIESEVGPELIYKIANNDTELERFSKMSKARKLAYLAAQEDVIVNASKNKGVTEAPKPIAKVANTKPNTASDTSYSEWLKERNKSKRK